MFLYTVIGATAAAAVALVASVHSSTVQYITVE